jgi:glycosyltransferase involved in cell wall biosynthesis
MKVSIIIPAFNRKELLKGTIDSVLEQSFINFECIITDNCSTDGAFELAHFYARKDCRVRVFQNEENVGPVRNWLNGVEKARYPWVKILFSDDILHPDCIAQSVQAVSGAHDKIGAVFFGFKPANLPSQMDRVYSSSAFLISYILPGNRISCSPSAYLLRRDNVLRALSLNLLSYLDLRDTGVGYDIASIVFSVETKKVHCISNQLVYYRDNPESMTRLAAQDQAQFFLSIKYHIVLLEIFDKCSLIPRNQAQLLKAITACTILYYRARTIIAKISKKQHQGSPL